MKDVKSLFDMFRKFNYILTSKQKSKAIGVFFIMIIGALFETIGVSIIIPFVSAMINPNQLLENRYVVPIAKIFNITTGVQLIVLMSIAVIAIYIIKNGYLLMSSYIQVHFGCEFQKQLSVYMLKEYMKRPYTYFRNINSAMVYRGFNGDPQAVYRMMVSMMKFVAEFITVLAVGIFILVTDWMMAVGVMIIASLCFITIIMGFRNKTKRLGIMSRECLSKKDQYAYQTVNGIKEIMVMHREEYFVNDYKTSYDTQARIDTNFNFISACPDKIIEAVCISGLIAVVCVRMISGVDAVSFIPKLSAFAVAAFRILPSVGRMTAAVSGIVYDTAGLNALYNNLHEISDYEEERIKYTIENGRKIAQSELVVNGFTNEIKVDKINWKYDDAVKNVLDNLDLIIKKGQSIAFIGQSGAGKSTLADVLLGLFKPQSGHVYVDGVDIFTIKEEWCKLIGYVPQTIFMIDDTIRNNIIFGLPEEEVNERQVRKALEEAQLKEFVESQPEGIHTMLGEHGVKLSGGQRQRIAIARALYYNPPILVMDEATAALDNDTEAAVMESIDVLQGHKTLIIIAHRLTTVRNCDKIYEIVGGKAVERSKAEIFKA